MFSEKLKQYSKEKFESREKLIPFYSEIAEKINACDTDERVLMEFFYGTMPLRDVGEYEFSVFYDYVKHGLWLYRNVEWCRTLSEDVFVNYVLYYRINTENIVKNRAFFYEKIKDRIAEKTMKEAIIELNYWCAEQMTYQSTDGRTMSPITAYYAGYGRCGEESTFAVSVFRSAGIPARQVYTPLWAHCDDNHAWVEVFVDGEWHYLGACEPEENLDRGWFTGASGRAMMIHARTFSDFGESGKEDLIGRRGCLYFYNTTELYAPIKVLKITVMQAEKPIQGAKIELALLNMAMFGEIGTLFTNEKGEAEVRIGFGDVLLKVEKNGFYVEKIVEAKEEKIVLSLVSREESFLCTEDWIPFDFTAPPDREGNGNPASKEEKKEKKKRLQVANEKREKRIQSYYEKEKAVLFPKEEEFLKKAKGNFKEVFSFLKNPHPYTTDLLSTLTEKDFLDVTASLLETHLTEKREEISEEVFVNFVLAPRIYLEELSAYKSFIRTYFSKEEKEKFLKDPEEIWNYIEEIIIPKPEEDYASLSATPIGCLRMQSGNDMSKKILFVAICRTLGIPARVNEVDLKAEYYKKGVFVSPYREEKEGKKGRLVLMPPSSGKWNYFSAFTVAKLEKEGFSTFDFYGTGTGKDRWEQELEAGRYRFLLTNRMQNGNQRAVYKIFEVKEGEEVVLSPVMREGEFEDLLLKNELADFEVTDETGKTHDFSSLVKGEDAILAFLEEGTEPTEHVLNELCEREKELRKLEKNLFFILSGKSSLLQPTLKKTLERFPESGVYFDEELENAEPIARRMYVNPEKLPLLVALKKGMTGIYACSGYHVGSVDLLLKVLRTELPSTSE